MESEDHESVSNLYQDEISHLSVGVWVKASRTEGNPPVVVNRRGRRRPLAAAASWLQLRGGTLLSAGGAGETQKLSD